MAEKSKDRHLNYGELNRRGVGLIAGGLVIEGLIANTYQPRLLDNPKTPLRLEAPAKPVAALPPRISFAD